MNKVERNDPCPCGSGKKFKKCCGLKGINKKIQATILPASSAIGVQRLSNAFFKQVAPSESSLANKKIDVNASKTKEGDL